jgi:paraquat-inducible protein A
MTSIDGRDDAREMSQPGAASRAALRTSYPGNWLVPAVLIVAAGCLLTGQVLHGVTIDSVNREPETYSVMGGVLDLWTGGDPVLAVILFCFSIMFPTAKLLGLGWIWFAPMDPIRRTLWASRLELLGKWSMLDGFVVIALVGAIQLSKLIEVATARPGPAVYFFAIAIMLSMVLALRMSKMAASVGEVEQRVPRFDLSLVVAPWIAVGCLISALFFPIFRVEKSILDIEVSNVYALPSTTIKYFADGRIFLGLLQLLFAMLVPLVYFCWFGWFAASQRRGLSRPKVLSRLRVLGSWTMIDVYFLGLLLVVSKVGNLAHLERLPGFWLVMVSAVLSLYCMLRVRSLN